MGSLVGVRFACGAALSLCLTAGFFESAAFVRSLPLGRLPAGPSFVSQQKKQKCGSGGTARRPDNLLVRPEAQPNGMERSGIKPKITRRGLVLYMRKSCFGSNTFSVLSEPARVRCPARFNAATKRKRLLYLSSASLRIKRSLKELLATVFDGTGSPIIPYDSYSSISTKARALNSERSYKTILTTHKPSSSGAIFSKA